MRPLLLLFIVVPIIETWLLIQVGGYIGALPTIAMVLLTAVVGFHLLRVQGFETLFRGSRKLEQGQLPATEMVEGLMLAVCGALLLTPGFFTDAIGFAGLVPALRKVVAARLLRMTAEKGAFSATGTYTSTTVSGEYSQGASAGDSGIIEGEIIPEDKQK